MRKLIFAAVFTCVCAAAMDSREDIFTANVLFSDALFRFAIPQDEQLNKILKIIFKKLENISQNDGDLTQYIRAQIDSFGIYLRDLPDLLPMLEDIRSHMNAVDNMEATEENIEKVTLDLLATIANHQQALKCLAPILSKYQTLIYLLLNEQESHNKAISFFLFFIVNATLYEMGYSTSMSLPVGALLMKMLQKAENAIKHKAFLNKETLVAINAFDLLDGIKKQIFVLPKLDTLFRVKIIEHGLQKEIIDYKAIKFWLKKTYKFDSNLAKRVLDLAWTILLVNDLAQNRDGRRATLCGDDNNLFL